MKILHLISTLSAGGAELHLLTLCRYLKRHGVELVVACLREQVKGSRLLRPDFEEENIRVVNLQADSRYDWRFLGRLARLLKVERPHILHTHLPRADLAGAFGCLLSQSVVRVSSVHAIYSVDWSGRWTLPLCNFVWRRSDLVIAISDAVKDCLAKEAGVPPDRISVIQYGIEPERLAPPNTDLRKTWGLDGQAVVGSVGRLEPRKDHACLISAMPAVLELVPNACLLIAGHDPWGYGRKLQAHIDGLGLKEQVRLVGFQRQIPSFLHALDVFAFASRSEGFGQVVIEAMAAGKPVVASRIPPLTEIVVDGETGLLVEPEKPEAFAHAISWLLMHAQEARRMGRQGRERVRNQFSAQRMSVETLSLYERLTGEHDVRAKSLQSL